MARIKYFQKQKENFIKDFVKSDEQHFKEGLSVFGLLKILKRNIIFFSLVFGILSSIFIVVGFKKAKTQYYACGEISFNDYVYGDLYTTVQEDLQTDSFCKIIETNLSLKGALHENHSNITLSEIKSGLSSTHLSDSSNIIVKYYNTDESVVVPVVNEIIDSIVIYYDDGKDNRKIKQYISVGSYAELSFKDTPQLPFYLGFGLCGSFLIALASSFVLDKARTIISCPRDINCQLLQVISVHKKTKSKPDDFDYLIHEILKITNNSFKAFTIFPVGKSDVTFINELFNKHFLSGEINIKIGETINRKSSLCLTTLQQDEIAILVFESGKCSMKDLSSISLNQINDFSQKSIGVFIE